MGRVLLYAFQFLLNIQGAKSSPLNSCHLWGKWSIKLRLNLNLARPYKSQKKKEHAGEKTSKPRIQKTSPTHKRKGKSAKRTAGRKADRKPKVGGNKGTK